MPVQPTPEPDYVQRIKAENQQKLEQNPGWVTDENMPTPSDNFRAGAQGATAGLAPRLMD